MSIDAVRTNKKSQPDRYNSTYSSDNNLFIIIIIVLVMWQYNIMSAACAVIIIITVFVQREYDKNLFYFKC